MKLYFARAQPKRSALWWCRAGIPMLTGFLWHLRWPQFTMKVFLIFFVAKFGSEEMQAAELWLATRHQQIKAVHFVQSIMTAIGL